MDRMRTTRWSMRLRRYGHAKITRTKRRTKPSRPPKQGEDDDQDQSRDEDRVSPGHKARQVANIRTKVNRLKQLRRVPRSGLDPTGWPCGLDGCPYSLGRRGDRRRGRCRDCGSEGCAARWAEGRGIRTPGTTAGAEVNLRRRWRQRSGSGLLGGGRGRFYVAAWLVQHSPSVLWPAS